MKTIFISGLDTTSEHKNYIDSVGIQLLYKGWNIIISYKNYDFAYQYFEGVKNFWSKRRLTLLSKCDSIFMLKSYKKSKDSIAEYHFAKNQGIPIFYEKHGVPEPSQLLQLMGK
jgi:hypothetical protein